MSFINNKESLIKRRLLRRNQTLEENILWEYLRKNNAGLKWRRQVGMGFYIADFYCHSKKIIVELDGNHHYEEKK
jgi:very-short-patch-repair endonuclease